MKNKLFISALVLSAALGACSRRVPEPVAAPVSVLKPLASIQDIMAHIVDPAADALWASVGSVATKDGVAEHQPKTDAEWLAVRHHAVALVEASNLLLIEGRAVTHGGKAVEDAHVAGILDPQQVAQAIQADRGKFAKAAYALQDAGVQALAAIDARNPEQLLDVGAKLERACEHCHSVYWYPNDKRPTEKWPEPLTPPKP